MVILAVPMVSAQMISEVTINKNEFALNERLIVVVTIENSKDSSVYLESSVFNSNLNSHLNTKSIEIEPWETKKIILYNFIIDSTYTPDEYSVLLKLVDATNPNSIIDSKNLSFSVFGTLKDFYFTTFACKDQSCTEKSKIFTQDDTIYLAFDSGVSDPTIIASLEYPDGSKEQISLPAFLAASQIGTYNFEATASKPGYNAVNEKIQLDVIEKEADVNICIRNGICEANENYLTCPGDCPSGSPDGYCDRISDNKCDPDCSENSDLDCRVVKPKEENPNIIVPVGITLLFFLMMAGSIIISRKVQK